MQGGTVAVRGGTVAVRGGTVAVRGGTVAVQGGTVAVRGGTVAVQGGTVAVRGGTVAVPGGMIAVRTIFSGRLKPAPANADPLHTTLTGREAKEPTMSTVPKTRLGKVEFYEAHIAPWTANAAAIGLTPAMVTALSTLTTQARAAYNAAEAARQAAKAATQNFHDKVRAMHNGPGAGADMIDAIRLWAQTKSDPNVYVLAQIPAPATPAPTPPPGTPFEFTVGLLQTGAVELRWKCNNPSGTQGTVYEVMRRLGGTGPFVYVGSSGSRSFTDETLPAGAAPVTYQVTAVRSTTRGNPAQFTVNFGNPGDGLTIASVTDTSPGLGVKIAA